jgi:D-3-phosphoglycerate dehydrogenase / 2-oxoglutarate reductase
MSTHTVVLTDQVFPTVDIERQLLGEIDAELVVASGTKREVAELARDADALLNTYFAIDRPFIDQLTRCKVIARYGIGIDNIDVRAAVRAGIVVTNVPDYCVEEVAAHTVALLLGLLRKIDRANTAVRDGRWGTASVQPIHRLTEVTIGLIGYGRIARRVGEVMRVLGCHVIAHDPYLETAVDGVQLVSLDELLASADAVSLHAPLTPLTHELIGHDALAAMQPHAVLVNTSRGGLVSLDALTEALRDGEIGAAALDVLPTEPPNTSDIAGVPNLVVTPHMAFYSEEALAESQRKAARQVIRVLSGEAPDYPVARSPA